MSFEVQSRRGNSWVIEAVHDGEDEAVFDAQRLLQARKISAVRVVRETFDAASDSFKSKVIFRRERKIEIAVEGTEAPEHKAKMAREIGLYEGLWLDIKAFFKKLEKGLRTFFDSTLFLAIKFILIIGLGVWLLLLLRGGFEKL
jgi:hypothetical protein